MRSHHPYPLALIHEETAKKYGISDEAWCIIRTEIGSMTHKAQIVTNITPDVIIAEHGWWYPEEGNPLDSWVRSNINTLTSNGPVRGQELGTAMLRGVPCRVEPYVPLSEQE